MRNLLPKKQAGVVMTTIQYLESAADLTEDQVTGFFVGWPNPPNPEAHLRILSNTQHVVIAQERSSGKVVGFITAISDGVLSAYIPLLEVLPAHQGKGIGSQLTRQMLALLKNLYMIDLLCDPDVQPFYEQLSFVKAQGMMIRNYSQQSGDAPDTGA